MACELLTGFELDCRDSIGGIRRIMVANSTNVDSFTEMDGEVTDVVMETGTQFFEYQLRKQTSDWSETIEADDQAGTLHYTQELNIQLTKMEASKRNELFLVAKADVVAIVEDRNGKYWMLGANNGLMLSGNSTSGTDMGDFSGYELTFAGAEEKPAYEVEETVIDGLLEEAV